MEYAFEVLKNVEESIKQDIKVGVENGLDNKELNEKLLDIQVALKVLYSGEGVLELGKILATKQINK